MIDQSKVIRVLVVDDSAFMRKVISDLLNSEKSIKVIDTARDGKECITKAKLLNPDIITLDIEMPVMGGLEALGELMKLNPIPKVMMLSSLTYSGAEATIKALELGAVDFITKPTSSIIKFNVNDIKQELLTKIYNISNCRLSKPVGIRKEIERNIDKAAEKEVSKILKYIIAIGTSTGGPRALQDVIPLFPPDIPAAILIVQHMPPGFTNSLAARLDSISGLSVKEAADGDILKAGHAYIAPGDYHMLIKKTGSDEYRISTNQSPPVTGHRPSVNAMMSSVADSGHKKLIAVMMTGMGNDGSEGILKIKQNGGYTIAQNEETCVVYGMPKSAVNIGAIDIITPLQEITKEIIKYMGVY
ncbi:MAG: protein-glutamate methylesterase/protein-glutamine glutaminase [Bacillota bacterium]